jgi:hypothetical protein
MKLHLNMHLKYLLQMIKPIMTDYWTLSLDKKVLIGVKESGEKYLVKSADEYTSPIQKLFKTGSELRIVTEKFYIYCVSKYSNKKELLDNLFCIL